MSKVLFILCSLLFVANYTYSQEEKQEAQVKLKYNPFKTPVEDQDDIWEVKFGSAHLLPNNNSIQSNKFSFNLGLQYFYEINLNPQKRFALAIGIGYNFQQLKLNGVFRSEEHTSELQSRPHLVCRLLLEKKNDSICPTPQVGCLVLVTNLPPARLRVLVPAATCSAGVRALASLLKSTSMLFVALLSDPPV